MSLALVLGSVFVALLTDFLKGNNEALRERNIELVVRQEERKYSSQQVAVQRSHPVRAQEHFAEPELPNVAAATPVAASEPVMASARVAAEVPRPSEEWATSDELAAVEAIAARIRQSVDSRAAADEEPEVARTQDDEEILVDEPVAEVLAEAEAEPEVASDTPPVAMPEDLPAEEPILGAAETEAGEESAPEERSTEPEAVEAEAEEELTVEAAETHRAGEPPEATEEEVRERENLPRFTIHAKVTPIDVVATERSVAAEALKLARELERVADLSPEGRPAETGLRSDWESDVISPLDETTAADTRQGARYSRNIFAKEQPANENVTADQEETVAEEPEPVHSSIPEPTQETVEQESPALIKVPTGFQEYSQLSEAMSSDSLFRGTIVAIGVSDGGRMVGEKMLASVGEFVESLLTPADFGCQNSRDEFLVILPEELGAQSQRRLQYLSQRLWDFQIRTVGTQSIMFSWGAAEITDEPLREAIESARDRMLQTRRTRERATSEIHHYRVRAAND